MYGLGGIWVKVNIEYCQIIWRRGNNEVNSIVELVNNQVRQISGIGKNQLKEKSGCIFTPSCKVTGEKNVLLAVRKRGRFMEN